MAAAAVAVVDGAPSPRDALEAPTMELVVGEGRRDDRQLRVGVAFGPDGPVFGPPVASPAVVGILGEADFAAVLRGEVAFDTAYMQGRLKLTGAGRDVLAVLRATATDAWRSRVRAVAAVADLAPVRPKL